MCVAPYFNFYFYYIFMIDTILKNSKWKIALTLGLILVIWVLLIMENQITILRKAHSSFENYYSFRGCTELVEKGPDYGVCRVSSGKTIKIVQFEGKWYLDGDLPNCGYSFCL